MNLNKSLVGYVYIFVLCFALFGLLGAHVISKLFYQPQTRLQFELSLVIESGVKRGKLYYDTGSGFNETESIQINYDKNIDDDFHRYGISFPTHKPIHKVRFDPLEGTGKLTLKNIYIARYTASQLSFLREKEVLIPLTSSIQILRQGKRTAHLTLTDADSRLGLAKNLLQYQNYEFPGVFTLYRHFGVFWAGIYCFLISALSFFLMMMTGRLLGLNNRSSGSRLQNIPEVNAQNALSRSQAFFAFMLVSIYILSTSINFHIVHLVIDINMAKIGMLIMMIGVWLIVRKDYLILWKELKLFLLFSVFWTGYLLFNAVTGATPLVSIKLVFRIVGCWIVAFELALLFHRHQHYQKTVLASLIFCLLVIFSVWYLNYEQILSFEWFKERLPNYAALNSSRQSLYINPNEFGYALIFHFLLLLLYLANPVLYPFIFPLFYLIVSVGVYSSLSRNSVIGLVMLAVVGMVRLFQSFVNVLGRKTTQFVVILSLVVIIVGYQTLSNPIPNRTYQTLSYVSNTVRTDPFSFFDSEKLDRYLKRYPGFGLDKRKQIWSLAHEHWMKSPWTGIGIGSFTWLQNLDFGFNIHSFLYGVLVEQGIIGLCFMLLFAVILIRSVKSWFGRLILVVFPFTLLFDDLSWSYIFPHYLSLMLGFYFYEVLKSRRITDLNEGSVQATN